MSFIFCKFENGRATGHEGREEELIGYVEGLAAASLCLKVKIWVTHSLPNEGGPDNDAWLTPDEWLMRL